MSETTTNQSSNVGQILKAYIERVERTNEEIKALNDDKKDIFAEAKGNGFDVNTIKEIVKRRNKDPNDVAEAETLLETYMRAIEAAK